MSCVSCPDSGRQSGQDNDKATEREKVMAHGAQQLQVVLPTAALMLPRLKRGFSHSVTSS